jgi:hypothetical protein
MNPTRGEAGHLHGEHCAADAAVRRIDVAANMRLGHGLFGDVLGAAESLYLILQLLDGAVEQTAWNHPVTP